ncbi:MAG TPA: tRNA preQ1(34) S-adenosylmethionine ribosyltransferase-isomerase QueA [Steroidobacteraceae bacterium]|nr:tRNA preQ1(34) S-adenosylmethionine ribosyltransferase-isomerase QueA [Steroidobacteraceae bacterium]
MRRADFSFPLPAELIADRPLPRRGASRLLALDGASGAIRDLAFDDLGKLLRPGDLLVLNDTRVLPARLRGHKASGGACELLLERILEGCRFLAQGRSSKGFAPGTRIALPAGAIAVVVARRGEFHEFELDREALPYFEAHGSVPLPPYVAREADSADRERYQTVYAAVPGAVAAPTAGLHFDADALSRLERDGVALARVTLHVGAGTFTPVRVEELADHRMHAERIRVPEATVEAIGSTRARGGRVVAVGTTVVRALESAASGGRLEVFEGESDIFIMPGHRFRAVDALLTNFHLPESTLLVLVAAFAGRERVLAAYHHAIAGRYRFFSYGDAMFVTPEPAAVGAPA